MSVNLLMALATATSLTGAVMFGMSVRSAEFSSSIAMPAALIASTTAV